MEQGNHHQALQFKFGIKPKGNMFEVKMRFSTNILDIAEFINSQVKLPNMSITNTSNKNTRTIYGHCTELELDMLNRCVMRAKSVRHRLIADSLSEMASRTV